MTNTRLDRGLLAATLGVLLCLSGCFKKDSDPSPYASWSPTEILKAGRRNEARGNFEAAGQAYETINARFPNTEWSPAAQLGLIRTLRHQKDVPGTLAAIDRFEKLYPYDAHLDEALFLKGVVYYEQHFSFMYRHLPLDRALRDPQPATEGLLAFQAFIQRFPKSPYLKEAQTKADVLAAALANHELHIAQFNLQKKAYVAAIQRAKHLIQSFPNTSAAKSAQSILEASYEGLNGQMPH